MGDPKKARKKFNRPGHPWERLRIDEEKEFKRDYGLRNKKEIWRLTSYLRDIKTRAKKLSSLNTNQAILEKEQLLKKLVSLGLLPENGTLSDVLTIEVKDLLERRLQTRIVRKAIARSVNQARQMITHGHVMVGKNKMTVPSYLVSIEEDNELKYADNSPFADPEHPEISVVVKEKPKSAAKEQIEQERAKRGAKAHKGKRPARAPAKK